MNRRTILAGVIAAVGLGGYFHSQSNTSSCDIACFEFYHEGFDDAPDWLTIRHTAGRDLPAEEVFITNVAVEHGPETKWVTETVAWHEVDEETDPTDDIGGKAVRVDIAFPDVVRVLWRHEGEEQVLDETRDFR